LHNSDELTLQIICIFEILADETNENSQRGQDVSRRRVGLPGGSDRNLFFICSPTQTDRNDGVRRDASAGDAC
jgi:hypothetical protein